MTDFQSLIPLLAQGEVEFIIVGGAAATVHGASRLTQDLDVVYRRTRENVARLVRVLEPCQPYLREAPPGLPFRLDADAVWNGSNFTLTTTLGDLDLLGEITAGGRYEDLLPHTEEVEVFGVRARVLGLAKLIEVKRAVGRLKDREAIAELEALRSRRGAR